MPSSLSRPGPPTMKISRGESPFGMTSCSSMLADRTACSGHTPSRHPNRTRRVIGEARVAEAYAASRRD